MRSRFLLWAMLPLLGLLSTGCAGERAASSTDSSMDPSTMEITTTATPSAPVVMFIGDSYAAGWGPVPEEDAYAAEAARRLGWQLIVAAHGGIGYVAPGRVRRTFQEVFDRELAWRPAPDLVVVAGGHNDRKWSPAKVEIAAERLVKEIKSTWRDAAVALVGPMWGGDTPPAGVEIGRRLARVASRARVPFVDPVRDRWMTRAKARRFILPDGTHPSKEGHRYFAGRLVEGLRKTGLDEGLVGR